MLIPQLKNLLTSNEKAPGRGSFFVILSYLFLGLAAMTYTTSHSSDILCMLPLCPSSYRKLHD